MGNVNAREITVTHSQSRGESTLQAARWWLVSEQGCHNMILSPFDNWQHVENAFNSMGCSRLIWDVTAGHISREHFGGNVFALKHVKQIAQARAEIHARDLAEARAQLAEAAMRDQEEATRQVEEEKRKAREAAETALRAQEEAARKVEEEKCRAREAAEAARRAQEEAARQVEEETCRAREAAEAARRAQEETARQAEDELMSRKAVAAARKVEDETASQAEDATLDESIFASALAPVVKTSPGFVMKAPLWFGVGSRRTCHVFVDCPGVRREEVTLHDSLNGFEVEIGADAGDRQLWRKEFTIGKEEGRFELCPEGFELDDGILRVVLRRQAPQVYKLRAPKAALPEVFAMSDSQPSEARSESVVDVDSSGSGITGNSSWIVCGGGASQSATSEAQSSVKCYLSNTAFKSPDGGLVLATGLKVGSHVLLSDGQDSRASSRSVEVGIHSSAVALVPPSCETGP